MMQALPRMTALAMGEALRRRELGAVEVAQASLDAAKRAQPALNAMITLSETTALEQAKAIQARLDAGETLSPLAGVPMAIKDNIVTKGLRTTCASRMLADYLPPFDATAAERLHAAGAVSIGKLNMDEFAMGSTSETSFFGAVRNPWHLEHSPGGSSGGAAAAVAAGIVPYALGSDTGGSIRQPCAFCGVTGLKPSYGAISRWGLIAYGSSLDQIGPIARDVRDCAAAFAHMAGRDPRDGTTVADYAAPVPERVEAAGLRIGLPRQAFEEGLQPEMRAAVLDAAARMEQQGARVEWVDMPMLRYAVPAYYIIASAEAASNLSRYDGLRYGHAPREAGMTLEDAILRARSEGFGREVKRRLMLGNFALSAGYYDAYYNKALQVKALLRSAFDSAFERFDVLLTPTASGAAMRLGESLGDPLSMYLGDVHTVAVNLAGLPALAQPCGLADGLPLGLQWIGAPFAERTLFRVGLLWEAQSGWNGRMPKPDWEGGKADVRV